MKMKEINDLIELLEVQQALIVLGEHAPEYLVNSAELNRTLLILIEESIGLAKDANKRIIFEKNLLNNLEESTSDK